MCRSLAGAQGLGSPHAGTQAHAQRTGGQCQLEGGSQGGGVGQEDGHRCVCEALQAAGAQQVVHPGDGLEGGLVGVGQQVAQGGRRDGVQHPVAVCAGQHAVHHQEAALLGRKGGWVDAWGVGGG